MFKHIGKLLIVATVLFSSIQPAFAVLPNIFATQPSGNVAASLLDQNYTFLEKQGVQGLTTSGSSNAYVATPADAWVTGYSNYVGRALTVVPNFTNSAASTINVSGLGAASIYKNVGGVATALASGDIVTSVPAVIVCDGTGFLLVNPTPPSASSSAMVLLSTQTITNAASVLDTTHITSAYTHYIFECSNLTPSSGTPSGFITLQQGGSFVSSGYGSQYNITNSGGNTAGAQANGSQLNITGSAPGISAVFPNTFVFEFWVPNLPYVNYMFRTTQFTSSVSAGMAYIAGGGFESANAVTTGVKFAFSGGNIATATCNLYGIQ